MVSTTEKEKQADILKDLYSELDIDKILSDSKTKLVGENHNENVNVRTIVKDNKFKNFVHEQMKTAALDRAAIYKLMLERVYCYCLTYPD